MTKFKVVRFKDVLCSAEVYVDAETSEQAIRVAQDRAEWFLHRERVSDPRFEAREATQQEIEELDKSRLF